ncbi:MAG TPA: adenosylcobinamide-GDP ribazoletransferase, partial [Desulfosarcina sp.]|nr:adenosylcobinamide-GDP ribazoletransferase [Desulfosarcina sp.]
AVQFLSVIPLGRPGTFEPKTMISWFPVVGLLLGAVTVLGDMAAGWLWPRAVVSVLDVLLLIFLTGALHLDGLADTADGMYGGRPPEKALEIMKDSRVGAMGLVAVVSVLGVKAAGLAACDHDRWLFLLVIPALARSSTLFGFRFLPYGRPGGGTGHALFEHRLGFRDFRAVGLPIVLALLAGWRGVLVILTFAGVTAVILIFYKRRMGCITGDMLGAMTEITEAALFLAAATGGGS